MSISLPFYRAPEQLPSPLPTLQDIEAATKELPTIRNPDYDGRIVAIRDQYVVKYGTYVAENEGQTLLFIEQHLRIPIPRLYAMYRHDGKLYLVMELIPGTELRLLWPSLSAEDKRSIAEQLRGIFDKLRSLPSPGYFGSIAKRPLRHRYFLERNNDPIITGPFDREEDLSLALAKRSEQNWRDNGRHGWVSDFFARHLPTSLKGHQPTFTHSDLHPQNILIREVVNAGSQDASYEVSAIVDWETAGWYPAYWEYAAAFALFQWVDDWPLFFEKFIDPWPLEASMLKFVHQDLEF
ncbi:kinase-like domain-containing protein [Lineolata rhizophorae]|uniref:Kinase-like domain-containing protein n=1 Tax=Lineolata rhizophorae TaxID=578093 RepID=A0A6A6NVW5_9PEZI|nr:kinase-like domain-containing protein [Lineolata rhizophorae]